MQSPFLNFENTLEVLARLLCGNLKAETIPLSDWETVLHHADEHKVLMPIYEVYRAAFPEQANHPAYMQLAFSQRVYTLQLEWIVSEIMRVFAAHDLSVIWLKGVVLAHSLYDQPWLRYMRDLDFLVPYERRHQALQLLKDMGFIHTANGIGAEFEKFHSDYQLSYKNQDHLIVAELHYDPLAYVSAPPFVDARAWFWQHTHTIKTPMGDLHAFTDEAMFLHLVLHDVFHHERRFPDTRTPFEPPQLRRKYDIYLLLTRVKLDFEAIFQGAKTLDCLYAVVCELEDMRQLFGLDFSGEIARFKADEQYPVRFNFRERDAYIKVTLLKGTLRDHSPREIVGFIKRIFIGSPVSLRDTLNIPGERRLYPHHYVIRMSKRIFGFAAALPGLLIKSLRKPVS